MGADVAGSIIGKNSRIAARFLLPEIQSFFESEEGQQKFAERKAQQKQDKAKQA